MKDPQSGPSIEVSQEKAIEGIGGDPNRKEHNRRSPLYSYSAYKVQKPSETNKLVTK